MGIINIVLELFILAIVIWIAVMLYNYIDDNKSDDGSPGNGSFFRSDVSSEVEKKAESVTETQKQRSSDEILKQFTSKADSVKSSPSPVSYYSREVPSIPSHKTEERKEGKGISSDDMPTHVVKSNVVTPSTVKQEEDVYKVPYSFTE